MLIHILRKVLTCTIYIYRGGSRIFLKGVQLCPIKLQKCNPFPHSSKYPFVSVLTNLTGSNHENISGFVLLVFYHFLFFSRGV